MRRCLWLPALLGLTVVLPATSQEGLRLGDAVTAALAVHRSVVEAEAAVRAAALALRLAEIDASRVTVSVSATPAVGVDLAPLPIGGNGAGTFDADGSGTVNAVVALPWGMDITGSYTASVDLDGAERDAERYVDVHSVSVSQDLLPEGRLAATAVAVAGRSDQHRLARLRLQRVRNEVALQVVRSFLTLIERTPALALLEQRLALAERELAHTRTLVAREAADQLDLLDATIAVTEQRNSIEEARATLALDTAQLFADLNLPPQPLAVPVADLAALRRRAGALLAQPAPPAALAAAPEVLEAEAALSSAELQAARAQRGVLPELSVSLDYRKPRSAPRPGTLSLSLTGSYTLFDGGRNAVASAQAQEQVAAARRTLAATRTELADAFGRSHVALTGALVAEELAALRLERAHLRLQQATRRHAAGAISETALQEAALALRAAAGDARAAAAALGYAYLGLALDHGLDLQQELAAIAG